jgi:hypothetical protein
VKYFNNKNNNEEIISTNYITLNNYGYNNCSRTSSNYSYIKHPNGLIYKTCKVNDGINNAINVDEFKKKFVKIEIDENNVLEVSPFSKRVEIDKNMWENDNIVLENVSNDIIEGSPRNGDEIDDYLPESCYEFDNYLNSSENEINNFLQPVPKSDDEIDDYSSDNFLEQVLENSNENDNYSSESESDISSSDRELLEYYY